MTTIGVLDRTGALLGLAEQATERAGDADVVDLGSPVLFGRHSRRVDVLVLGPKELTPTGLRRATRWHALHPASAMVAAVEDAAWSREELAAFGIRFVVRGEPTRAKLGRALSQSAAELALLTVDVAEMGGPENEPARPLTPSWTQMATEPLDAAEEPTSASRRPTDGVLVTIASASGGSGKTFFATNLAAHLAGLGQRVLLVDLDLQFGEVAPVLRLRHPYSVYDGLYGPEGHPLPPGALAENLNQLVCHHELGFDVLTAPRDPSLADYVGAKDAARVLDAVLPLYQTVIVDTPPSLNEVVLVALDRSDVVPVLATLDVPSLKNLGVFLSTLQRLRIDDSGVRLILNKVERDVGITVKQAQESFKGRFMGFIPADRGVSRSINSGEPIVASAARSQVARALVETITATFPRVVPPLPAVRPDDGPEVRRKHWWHHLFRSRRSLVEA